MWHCKHLPSSVPNYLKCLQKHVEDLSSIDALSCNTNNSFVDFGYIEEGGRPSFLVILSSALHVIWPRLTDFIPQAYIKYNNCYQSHTEYTKWNRYSHKYIYHTTYVNNLSLIMIFLKRTEWPHILLIPSSPDFSLRSFCLHLPAALPLHQLSASWGRSGGPDGTHPRPSHMTPCDSILCLGRACGSSGLLWTISSQNELVLRTDQDSPNASRWSRDRSSRIDDRAKSTFCCSHTLATFGRRTTERSPPNRITVAASSGNRELWRPRQTRALPCSEDGPRLPAWWTSWIPPGTGRWITQTRRCRELCPTSMTCLYPVEQPDRIVKEL